MDNTNQSKAEKLQGLLAEIRSKNQEPQPEGYHCEIHDTNYVQYCQVCHQELYGEN